MHLTALKKKFDMDKIRNTKASIIGEVESAVATATAFDDLGFPREMQTEGKQKKLHAKISQKYEAIIKEIQDEHKAVKEKEKAEKDKEEKRKEEFDKKDPGDMLNCLICDEF